MTTARPCDDLHQRWRRLQIHVRCALHPQQPERIALFLQCGAKLARRDGGSPIAMHPRMLRTLLQTSRDVALPLPWRRACVEPAELLLAYLRALMRWHDPQGLQALEEALRDARDALSSPRLGVR